MPIARSKQELAQVENRKQKAKNKKLMAKPIKEIEPDAKAKNQSIQSFS